MGKVTVEVPWKEIRGMIIKDEILTITLESPDYPESYSLMLDKNIITRMAQGE